jgi:glycosyltransferase involved in cell wall biosynthesis
VTLRIAHVIDYFHTDVGYQEYYLAKSMAEAGHTVRVVSSHFRQHTVAIPGPDEASGERALVASGVELVRLPARQLGHDRAWLRGLRHSLAAFRPDAIHCHGAFAPTTVRTAAQKARLGCSLLVDNHIQEFIAPGATSGLGRLTYGSYRSTAGPFLQKRVDHWVAIGPYEREFLARRMNLGIDDVEMVPLGFDPAIFNYNGTRRAALRSERGWSGDTVIAVTGKLNIRKRSDLVSAACAEALEKGKSIRLVLAGSVDEDARAAVERAAGDLPVESRLEFLPMLGREQLADLYLCSDVVVFARLPSISIYEAAGTGVRVLVGRDSFSEWLQAQLPAIEPVDPTDLVDVLEPADDRAKRAFEAREAFSWAVLSERFVDLYGCLE